MDRFRFVVIVLVLASLEPHLAFVTATPEPIDHVGIIATIKRAFYVRRRMTKKHGSKHTVIINDVIPLSNSSNSTESSTTQQPSNNSSDGIAVINNTDYEVDSAPEVIGDPDNTTDSFGEGNVTVHNYLVKNETQVVDNFDDSPEDSTIMSNTTNSTDDISFSNTNKTESVFADESVPNVNETSNEEIPMTNETNSTFSDTFSASPSSSPTNDFSALDNNTDTNQSFTLAPTPADTSAYPTVGSFVEEHSNEDYELEQYGDLSMQSTVHNGEIIDKKASQEPVMLGLLLGFFLLISLGTLYVVKMNPHGLCATIVRCLGLITWSVISCPFRLFALRGRRDGHDDSGNYYSNQDRFVARDLELY